MPAQGHGQQHAGEKAAQMRPMGHGLRSMLAVGGHVMHDGELAADIDQHQNHGRNPEPDEDQRDHHHPRHRPGGKQQMRAHDRIDRPRGADHRHQSRRRDQGLGDGGGHRPAEIKGKKAQRPAAILDRQAKGPQEEHIADQMLPARMQEDMREQRPEARQRPVIAGRQPGGLKPPAQHHLLVIGRRLHQRQPGMDHHRDEDQHRRDDDRPVDIRIRPIGKQHLGPARAKIHARSSTHTPARTLPSLSRRRAPGQLHALAMAARAASSAGADSSVRAGPSVQSRAQRMGRSG